MRYRKYLKGSLFIFLSIIVCVITFFPIYWMINISIKLEIDLFAYPPKVYPNTFNISGYIKAFEAGEIFIWIKNSIIVTVLCVLLNLTAASLGAFGLSRFNFKSNKILIFIILSTQMIAPALIVGPIYILLNAIKLTNNLFGLAFVNTGMTLAFSTWILKGFFDNIPKEIDEAAYIDGCSKFKVFTKIIFPLSIPAVISIILITFFDVYNEYMFALTLITGQNKWLGTVGIAANTTRMGTPWNIMLAQTSLFCIVPIIVYFVFQRYIIRGLTAGAIKS